ncbi:BglG family transcription antiterminator [Bacillus massiliglaciei]|uniref:BglG family transcription antiterminator n=1 Tax=Bacillus massiliglaciei TaxID=1816693 RepID=UPI000B0D984E|nr:HTH domain-containing protein [Bacillus massiliglaciei]
MKNLLTTREIQIVTKLLGAEKTVRTKDLSAEFHVSTRTIKSDLDKVRKWFQQEGVSFYAQSNKGYWVESSKNERLKLYRLLMEMKGSPLYPDQNMRIEKMLYLFLSHKEYMTTAEIANHLLVSRNTVISDLDYLENFIQPWMVTLERKPRIGYKLVGNEIHIRLLFEHMIQENLSHFDMYKIISQLKSNVSNDGTSVYIQEIQHEFDLVMGYIRMVLANDELKNVPNAEILSILMRLIIFLVRIESEFTIGSYRLAKKGHYHSSASSEFIFEVMDQLCQELGLPLLEDEFLYVHRNFLLEDKELNLLTVTEEMIRHVSQKEQIPYDKDTRLFNNLLTHLSLRFEKNKTYVTEVNPFTNEIKRNNSSLFSSIKEACEFLFGKHSCVINDSFLSFIALHFLVSYENGFKKKPRIKALYVCSTGRGVARLIKNRVEREIGEINITSYCSVIEADEISKNEDIDLIISVFPIQSSIPVVVVEPVPTEESIQIIQEKFNELIKNKVCDTEFIIEKNETSANEDYEMISQEIIVKGFELSYEFSELLKDKIPEDKKRGLQVHLFLMVHRYYFHQQYDQFIHQTKDSHDEGVLTQINTILERHNIFINDTERNALLTYFQ